MRSNFIHGKDLDTNAKALVTPPVPPPIIAALIRYRNLKSSISHMKRQ
jgi:hypothetical protein